MKDYSKAILCICITLSLYATSCKKDSATPASDRMAMLTKGKWYWRPSVELALKDPESGFSTCNLDDYIVFRSDSTCDWNDGATKCGTYEGEIEHGYNIPWMLTNNQTTIRWGDDEWQIIELSDEVLDFGNGMKLKHGN